MKTPKGLEGASFVGTINCCGRTRNCWLLDGKIYSANARSKDVIPHRFSFLDAITLATNASNGLRLSDGQTVIHWDGKVERRMGTS